MMPREPIPTVVRKLAKELAEPTPMRRGSVSERFMKCGQKECRCQHDPQARHGPYFTLTRSEEGKTRSRYLSAEQAALARQHVEAGHEFRKQVERYWQACERWGDTHDEARKCIDYVERNQERMRYPKFRAAGLCTSTGVVEAGCKVAIGTRCKRAGMHWTVAGVDAIIALRCCKLSGRFEGFWERRAQRRVA